MASRSLLRWIQTMAWVGVYGGLLSIVLGVFLARIDMGQARLVQTVGSAMVAIGVLLIWIRSLMKENP